MYVLLSATFVKIVSGWRPAVEHCGVCVICRVLCGAVLVSCAVLYLVQCCVCVICHVILGAVPCLCHLPCSMQCCVCVIRRVVYSAVLCLCNLPCYIGCSAVSGEMTDTEHRCEC